MIAKVHVREAATELMAARNNLNEVVERLNIAAREIQNATLALNAAHSRVVHGEARLRSAEAEANDIKTN